MEYIKFNCHDLAAQNAQLHESYGKMRDCAERLSAIFKGMDVQIKSYDDIYRKMAALDSATGDISNKLLNMYNALDRIIDVYYAAENRVLRASEELPVIIQVSNNKPVGGSTTVLPVSSAINSGDIIMENWLAELVYGFGERNID